VAGAENCRFRLERERVVKPVMVEGNEDHDAVRMHVGVLKQRQGRKGV
jgi:hypothetical protein